MAKKKVAPGQAKKNDITVDDAVKVLADKMAKSVISGESQDAPLNLLKFMELSQRGRPVEVGAEEAYTANIKQTAAFSENFAQLLLADARNVGQRIIHNAVNFSDAIHTDLANSTQLIGKMGIAQAGQTFDKSMHLDETDILFSRIPIAQEAMSTALASKAFEEVLANTFAELIKERVKS